MGHVTHCQNGTFCHSQNGPQKDTASMVKMGHGPIGKMGCQYGPTHCQNKPLPVVSVAVVRRKRWKKIAPNTDCVFPPSLLVFVIVARFRYLNL